MQEDFLQFVWQYRLFNPDVNTSDGRPIGILKPGELNRDSGPDFLNALLRIGDTQWAGHVEIHVNASDWARHGHQKDKAYDNVILHVVYVDDYQARNSMGELLPVLVLRGRIFHNTMQRFSSLSLKQKELACAPFLAAVPGIVKESMLERCAAEKMQLRTDALLNQYRLLQSDPDTLAYQCLARAMGFKVNADAFLLLTRLLPYSVVRKLRSRPMALPAVVLGCAGLLPSIEAQGVLKVLGAEWEYWHKTLHLRAMEPHLWRFARTRPANHPDRRLVQFACILHNSGTLFHDLSKGNELHKVRENLCDLGRFPSEWAETGLNGRDFLLSGESIDLLIINVCHPLRSLAVRLGMIENPAHDMIEALGSEDNRIIRLLQKQGMPSANAWQSQGALQLYNRYCRVHRCLSCSVGANILGRNDEG
jgi:hypothetical protein